MPCNSDYMNPTTKEREIIRAAKLTIFVLESLGKRVPSDLRRRAADVYGADRGPKNDYNNPQPTRSDDAVVALLCKTVKGLSEADRDRIVYNGRNAQSRDLADWVEAHEKADRERIEREEADKARRAARESAKAKLSPAERRAVGL